MQVMDLPPNNDQYPEHDHADDGQEEVYVALRGSRRDRDRGRAPPDRPRDDDQRQSGTTRKVYTGDEPLRLLIVGGVPGKAYEAPEITELGGPDPFAEQLRPAQA